MQVIIMERLTAWRIHLFEQPEQSDTQLTNLILNLFLCDKSR